MRIAMIGQKGIALGERGGGIETHVHELSRRLVLLGHDVSVYARKAYVKKPRRTQDNINLIFIPTIYKKNLEAIVHTVLSTLHALFQSYDIIHYHGVGPATLAWIPRIFKPGCKVVVTFHSQDRFHAKWGLLARNYLHFGEWAACWFPDVTISVSRVIQAYARKYYRRQVVYIPNGAELKTVRAAGELRKFGLKRGEYILNVSRLVPHKGQHYLILAFQKLTKKARKNMKLVIVGAPAYTDEYLKKLKELAGDDPDILFLGYQSGKALEQLYAHAYLYVQPSESEGLAVTVLEAMSYGTAVLVSDIKENLEVKHQAGFSFKNKDIRNLANQLEYLIMNKKEVKNASALGKEAIHKYFHWDVVAQHTDELYRTIRH